MNWSKNTWCGLGGPWRRRISTRGITKARVFPEPVAASTATSLKLHSKGVQNSKRDKVSASRTASESGGSKSENLVVVSALFGFSSSAAMMFYSKTKNKRKGKEA
ncbi:NAD(P)H-hydrate epimerase [Striga asiatica]|uniref:NAD(P)H-hydrate epimerase n=1 Tax=Striga asiatica TaxID=4170 RepID=A0A5A7RFC0_STRAF|nr:NAD(P)H-hydrate epimerase [Striga asiatica]